MQGGPRCTWGPSDQRSSQHTNPGPAQDKNELPTAPAAHLRRRAEENLALGFRPIAKPCSYLPHILVGGTEQLVHVSTLTCTRDDALHRRRGTYGVPTILMGTWSFIGILVKGLIKILSSCTTLSLHRLTPDTQFSSQDEKL